MEYRFKVFRFLYQRKRNHDPIVVNKSEGVCYESKAEQKGFLRGKIAEGYQGQLDSLCYVHTGCCLAYYF